MAPNDEELLRYVLDDEPLSVEEQIHLGHCAVCQQRLAECNDYKDLNTLLISRLYRSQCPSAMDLNFFCERVLPIDDIVRIDGHIRQCPLCATEVADIQDMLASFPL
jgi:coenzyme F420-reducing hydrogenase gamma subunit